MVEFVIADSPLADLPSPLLYRILALRVEVFVVEQGCFDGRDLEPATRLLWVERDGAVVATLRILDEGNDVVRIGRVATAVGARNSGLGASMMKRAIELIGDQPIILAAQAHLADWYSQFGFVRDGDDYFEHDILHTPMRLRSAQST
jgi:ElaA protein